jgi:DNA-binding GntR family transcriptional regulator
VSRRANEKDGAVPSSRISAVPLSAIIADSLREDIVSGRLRQGDPVTQQSVAEKFGVSTMPVREALLALSHEGMIVARTNHTFRVARLAPNDVEDIYWTHGMLAGKLAHKACERISPELLASMEATHAEFLAAHERGDTSLVEELNWEFHRIINYAADSPKILATLKTTVAQIPTRFYTMLETWSEVSIHGHEDLLEAFRNGNCDEAGRIATEHVAEAGVLMIEYLRSNSYWDQSED